MQPFSTFFINEGVSNAWASFFKPELMIKAKRLSSQVSLIGQVTCCPVLTRMVDSNQNKPVRIKKAKCTNHHQSSHNLINY